RGVVHRQHVTRLLHDPRLLRRDPAQLTAELVEMLGDLAGREALRDVAAGLELEARRGARATAPHPGTGRRPDTGGGRGERDLLGPVRDVGPRRRGAAAEAPWASRVLQLATI